jgi:predicted transcriptional regulator
MPIGIVSDDDFLKELNSSKESVKTHVPEIITPEVPGRKEGDNNVPNSLRKIIGETAVIEGRQEALDLAEMFGISASSVSAYAKGATSTSSYQSPAKSILSHINKSRSRSVKKASRVLNEALNAISPEKLADVKARDLAGIAKDMSAVIKNLEPDAPANDGEQAPQFVIFAPQFIKEENFDTIIVNE